MNRRTFLKSAILIAGVPLLGMSKKPRQVFESANCGITYYDVPPPGYRAIVMHPHQIEQLKKSPHWKEIKGFNIKEHKGWPL